MLWLAAIRDAGVGPVAPPISVQACTVVVSHACWVKCIWIVYNRQESVEVLQVMHKESDCDKIVAWIVAPACAFCGISTEFLLVVYGDCVVCTLPVVRWHPVTLGVTSPSSP